MKKNNLKVLLMGALIGVVLTLVMVKISDFLNQEEVFISSDDDIDISDIPEASLSAMPASKSAEQNNELEQF